MDQGPNNSTDATDTNSHQSGGIAFHDSVAVQNLVAGNQTINNISEDSTYDVSGLESPYLGLNSFTYDERGRYAGRTAEVAAALTDLVQPGAQRVLYFVTGTSGSGKSSFAQAGLLPALEAHYAGLGKTLRRLPVIRPGNTPVARLKVALEPLGIADLAALPSLSNRADAAPSVIVLDQFEEFFTQSPPDQRQVLFDQLTHLPTFGACQMHIIATVRSDYLDELFVNDVLWTVAKQGSELRQMSEDALKDAIQRPLQSKAESDPAYRDKRFEPALVDKLAQQAAAEPSLLPLLQVTLDELWRNKRKLTLSSYAVMQNGQFVRDGTLTDAIRKRADTVLAFVDYDEPSPNQSRSQEAQRAILSLLLDLVRVSLDDDYRRDVRANRNLNLMPAAQQVLARDLVHARLLSVSQTQGADDSAGESITIIHESLINNWDALREGVREQRLQLQRRARFEQDVRDWLANGQSDDYLLKDLALARAQELDRTGDVALTSEPHARELLTRSRAAAEVEQQRRIQEADARTRRARMLTAGLAVLLVVALITSVLAVNAQSEARRQQQLALNALEQAQQQAQIAHSQAVAGQVYANQDRAHDLSLLLGVAAYQITHTYEARSSILASLEHSPRLLRYGRAPVKAGNANHVAFNPNGNILASAYEDGSVLFWDTSDPAAFKPLGEPLNAAVGEPATLAWSPQGNMLAVGGSDSTIQLWDVRNVMAPQSIGQTLQGHTNTVTSLIFSPDGAMLMSGSDQTVILWDVRDPAAAQMIDAPLEMPTATGSLGRVVFSPNGKILASSNEDEPILLWDISDRTAIKQLSMITDITGMVTALAFSPDSRRLAANSDNTISLWDVSTPAQVRRISAPLHGHTANVLDLVFSSDGNVIASSGADNKILLWDVSNGDDVHIIGEPLLGQASSVDGIAFSPNGKTLVSGSWDGTLAMWDVSNTQVAPPIGTVWQPGYGPIVSIAFSPKAAVLASAEQDADVVLWDVSHADTPKQLSTIHTQKRAYSTLAFSPDGTTLAIGDTDYDTGKTLHLWDVRDATSPEHLSTLPAPSASVLVYRPDGRLLASGSPDSSIQLWDVHDPKTARPVGTPLLGHTDIVWDVAFSPDGKTLASASFDGTLRLWNVSDPQMSYAIGKPLLNQKTLIYSVSFSPDGQTLAAGDATGRIVLWDVRDVSAPKTRGTPLQGGAGAVVHLAFSPNGQMLGSTLTLWDVSDLDAPRPIGAPFYGHAALPVAAAFNSTGTIFATGGLDSRLILWDVDVEAWIRRACHIAARNLTQAEWKTYIGDEPYRKTCPEWPDGV